MTVSGGIIGGSTTIPKKEVRLVAKVLFGRQRLAFEVQELDNSPAAVRKILKKEKELQDERFGPSDIFGFGGHNDELPQGRSKAGLLEFIETFRASELAAKHSLQVKFQDIDRIDQAGDRVTLVLSQAMQCYIKPEGEPSTVTMEVAKSDITRGSKTLTFTLGQASSSTFSTRDLSKSVSFAQVRQMLSEQSPRLEALLKGQTPPDPVATPVRKRSNQDGPGSSVKKPRVDASNFVTAISAASGSWLERVVMRFQLKGTLDASVSDLQWKAYCHDRLLLEQQEKAALKVEDEEEAAAWPQDLGPRPDVSPLSFESYKEGGDEEEFASDVLEQIRSSVAATVKSSSLSLDPEVFARGVFLLVYHVNDADEGEPRTVETEALIYAPNGSGNFVQLQYVNHKRVRMSFTERSSDLVAMKGGPGQELPKQAGWRGKTEGCEKIFSLDFNEHRRKNPTKTSIASNATLTNLGVHLFGAEGAMSNRKVFGLLVRAAGLGKFGEVNGWPVALARRRFKCGKGEEQTDTEGIPGEDCEEDVNGCCVM